MTYCLGQLDLTGSGSDILTVLAGDETQARALLLAEVTRLMLDGEMTLLPPEQDPLAGAWFDSITVGEVTAI